MKGIASLALLLLLAGCNADRQSGGRLDEGNRPQWLSETVQPTNLRLSHDTSSSKTQIVQPSGGTMEVGAADGSFFILEIPSGALPAPTRITMTPVIQAEGLPGSSRMVATVQLAPDGLQLDKFAKLTIQPAAPVDEADAYGFAYSGIGSDAHLHPAQGDPGNVELSLSHFSGYGLLHIEPTDLAVRVLSRASAERDRLSAAISRSLLQMKCNAHRRKETRGEPDSVLKRLDRTCKGEAEGRLEEAMKLLIEYYQFTVRPLLLLAVKEPGAYECLQSVATSYRKAVAFLTGVDESALSIPDASIADLTLAKRWVQLQEQLQDYHQLASQGRATYTKAIMDELRERCRKGDVSAVASAFSVAQELTHLGGDDLALQAEVAKLLACNSFELEFVSQVTNRVLDAQFFYELKAQTKGATRFGPDSVVRDSGNWNVITPLVYVQYEAKGHVPAGAAFSPAGTTNSTIRVHSVQPIQGAGSPALTCEGQDTLVFAPNPDTMQVRLQIEAPTEITRLGPGKSKGQDWHRHFYDFRRYEEQLFEATEEMSGGPPPHEGHPLILLLPRSGSSGEWRLDFKTDMKPGSGLTLFEKGHIILRHKPQL